MVIFHIFARSCIYEERLKRKIDIMHIVILLKGQPEFQESFHTFYTAKHDLKYNMSYSGEPACSRKTVQHFISYTSNLYSGFCELCPLSQLLPGVDVWVMCPFKSLLQLLQLLRREGGATAPLFPLQGQVGLRIYI